MTRFSPNSVALVTGAAGDIGRATALRLAADGVSLALGDLELVSGRLDETRELCVAVGGSGISVMTTTFDVTNPSAVEAAIAQAGEQVGVPNLLFNNAGYQGQFANVVDVDLGDAETVLEVNVRGVITVLQATARALQSQRLPGVIVNTASMAGVSGAPNMLAYSASKAAVVALTKSAAKDLAPSGIRVNAISPAFIGPGAMWDNQVLRQAEVSSIYYGDDEDTVSQQMINQIPLRRYGSVDEVASVVSFLLSNESSYLTGQNLEISGGAG